MTRSAAAPLDARGQFIAPRKRDLIAALPADLVADYAALEEGLERVLKGANFVEVTHEELERAANEAGRIVNPVRTGVADFRAIRMFRRGSHTEELERRSWLGLHKHKLTIEV